MKLLSGKLIAPLCESQPVVKPKAGASDGPLDPTLDHHSVRQFQGPSDSNLKRILQGIRIGHLRMVKPCRQ